MEIRDSNTKFDRILSTYIISINSTSHASRKAADRGWSFY